MLFSNGLTFAETTPVSQEEAWGQTLTKYVDPNEINWLNTPDEKFMALYHDDSTGTLQGGVIILHGMGTHPDWPDVIAPLRKALPQSGWATLSIQLPAFEKGGQIKDYADSISSATLRIRAAIEQYKSNGIGNVVLLGHGLGAVMGASFLASNPDANIAAFVGISMPTYEDGETWMDLPKSIEKINLPMLDIYGSMDLASVTDNADKRARAARLVGMTASKNKQITRFETSGTATGGLSKVSGFISYRKFQIVGASHFFRGHERTLNKRIVGWLKRHARGMNIQN